MLGDLKDALPTTNHLSGKDLIKMSPHNPHDPIADRRSLAVLSMTCLRLSAILLALVIVSQLFNASLLKADEVKRPNFVLILADDLGVHDMSIEGSTFHETPHIDSLTKTGMRFTQAYACCQVCSPSRASIQLGQFPARHGITDYIGAASGTKWNRSDRVLPAQYVHELPQTQTTIAEELKKANYKTFFAGKWHLGGEGSYPADHGYEVNVGGMEKGSPPGGFFSPYNNPKLPDGPPGESLPLRLGDETAKFIRSQDRDQPFFAMLSFYSVHAPVETTQELWTKYREKAVLMPPRESRFLIDRTLPVRQVQDHPVYAGMMESMDAAVGRVLEAIEVQGIADNTVVIFTSDNGGVSSGDAYATCNLPLRGGKGRQWEGGIRAPLYVRAPGIAKPGSISATPVTGADFFPTMLDLAGLDLRPEQHLDGVSFVPVLNGETLPKRPLVWHYPHYGNQGGEPSGIYRDGHWKMIHYYEDDRVELYDLANDPGEQTDVSTREPLRAATMKQLLADYLKTVGAKFPELDARFTEKAGKAKQERIRNENLPKLEQQHARFLDADWSPNENWWGSQ